MKVPLPHLSRVAVDAGTRLLLLGLCSSVAVARGDMRDLLWVPVLVLAGLRPARVVSSRRIVAGALVVGEGVLLGVALLATGSATSPYLPYLLIPAFAAGLSYGLFVGLLPVASAALMLLAEPWLDDAGDTPGVLSAAVAQWLILAVLVAGVASWVRSVAAQAARVDALERAQVDALRLITELRKVARELPGTLDPGSTAEVLLQRVQDTLPVRSGAVLVGGAGRRQVVMARVGASGTWDLRPEHTIGLVDLWDSTSPTLFLKGLPTTEPAAESGPGVVVPLGPIAEEFGLLVVEVADRAMLTSSAVEDLVKATEPLLLPLKSAVLFDDVREGATRQERRRLSREIHDGIAQELASLGYLLDGVAADLAAERAVDAEIGQARTQIRRVLDELRRSLFDLRQDVDPEEGIGAAVSRHVRSVANSAGLVAHLHLNEAPSRLGSETESELLRIVQEAVANVRKHAAASNVWVTCTIDPPRAEVIIEDDGRGIEGRPSANSHGLAIMRERADRIRGVLTIEERHPKGTRLRVVVDHPVGRVPG